MGNYIKKKKLSEKFNHIYTINEIKEIKDENFVNLLNFLDIKPEELLQSDVINFEIGYKYEIYHHWCGMHYINGRGKNKR